MCHNKKEYVENIRMLQTKLEEAKSLLTFSTPEQRNAYQTRIDEIESLVGKDEFSVDVSIYKEVCEIVTKLQKLDVPAPETSVPLTLLKQILTAQVQSMCRLPVPLPQNFDKQAYNNFVNKESKAWIDRIQSEKKEDALLEMFNVIYNTCFLQKEVQQEYDELFGKLEDILVTKADLTSTDKRLLDLLKAKVQARNIQQSLVASVIDYYCGSYPNKPIPKQEEDGSLLHLTEKDTKILYHVSKDEDMFVNVAGVIGVCEDDARVIHKLMRLEAEKAQLVASLSRRVVFPDVPVSHHP